MGFSGLEETRTRVETCVARGGMLALNGEAIEPVTPPYGPIVAALRSALRAAPDIVTQSVPRGRDEVPRAPAPAYGAVQFGPSNGCGDNSVSVVSSGKL